MKIPKRSDYPPAALDQLVAPKQVTEILSISRPTLWRWERAGTIPKAYRLGGRVYWKLGELLDWLLAQLGEEQGVADETK